MCVITTTSFKGCHCTISSTEICPRCPGTGSAPKCRDLKREAEQLRGVCVGIGVCLFKEMPEEEEGATANTEKTAKIKDGNVARNPTSRRPSWSSWASSSSSASSSSQPKSPVQE